MHKIAPARERPFGRHLKATGLKSRSPIGFAAKGAGAGAITPLEVVKPTDDTVRPHSRNIFEDHGQPVTPQDTMRLR